MAQVDFFLKIDGWDGESPDEKHSKEIEVKSWSVGVAQSGSSDRGGGAGTGKALFQDISFTKIFDAASPNLLTGCASGEHKTKAVLVCRKAGKDQQEYLKVTLSDVIVSHYQTQGSEGSGGALHDSFSLNYSKIEFEYKAQKADGTLGGAVKKSYDLKANKAA